MEETEFILGNGEVVSEPTPTPIEANPETLLDAILTQKNEIIEKYSTNIEWIDRYFDGGFEMGQMVTILGDAEAGKTQLINQILCNVANNHKCLYFALEFNKRKLIKYFKQKLKNNTVTKKALNNIYPVTPDMIKDEEIQRIIEIMKYAVIKKDIKFIVIDSSMMIYKDGMAGEPEISEIFRLLHDFANKNDILLFVITQASKDDNKNNRVAIFGSQRATHLSDIIFYIQVERNDNNEISNRKFVIQKNKQEGQYGVVNLNFNRELLLFSDKNTGNTGTGQVKQVKGKSNSEDKKENKDGKNPFQGLTNA